MNSAKVSGTSSTGRQPRITCKRPQQRQRRDQLQHDEADRRADPVQRRQPGDAARDEERGGHDVAVVVVEEVGRRQQALRARAADRGSGRPSRSSRANASTARTTSCSAISATAMRSGPVHWSPTVRAARFGGHRYGEPVRTLVTGAAGFIGSTLVDRLLADGHDVIGVDDLSSGRSTNIVAAERQASFEFAKADIVDADLMALFADTKPEVVFHLAAQISVSQSVVDPQFDSTRQRRRHRAGRRGRPQDRRAQGRAHLVGRIDLRHPAGLPDERGRRRRPVVAVRREQGVRRGVPQHVPQPLRAGLFAHRARQRVRAASGPARRGGRRRDLLAGAAVRQAHQDLRRRLATPATTSSSTTSSTRSCGHPARRAAASASTSAPASKPPRVQLHSAIAAAVGVADEPEFHPPRLGDLKRSQLDTSRAASVLGWAPKVALADGVARTVEYFREV